MAREQVRKDEGAFDGMAPRWWTPSSQLFLQAFAQPTCPRAVTLQA